MNTNPHAAPGESQPGPLEAVELQTVANPAATVIWLHGLGADGYDFVPVVRELASLGAPAARYVFPHAPVRPVTINGGFVMRAWYDILGADLAQREDEAGIRASQAAVERLIEREVARGMPPARIVLAGFSQGGAIALQTGLRRPQPLAGRVVLSCYLPPADRFEAERHPAGTRVPVFHAHGNADPVVPIARGAAARDRLAALGHRVAWHRYAVPHSGVRRADRRHCRLPARGPALIELRGAQPGIRRLAAVV